MRVTVGVSGGIAAYKAAELVRELQRQALEVHVVMTAAATKFMQPLTFAALSGHKVITSLWDEAGNGEGGYEASSEQNGIEHIGEAQWAEALVVAPATANILAKFAHGIADDFLTTMYLATTAPVLVAPAMNVNMWEHPATKANLEITAPARRARDRAGYGRPGMRHGGRGAHGRAGSDRRCGTQRAGPASRSGRRGCAGDGGRHARGTGPGSLSRQPFERQDGICAGRSGTGRGAKVILISGPSALYPPAHCELVKVTTAEEMRQAVLARMTEATMVIKAAAVADYRPLSVSEQKLKRTGPITLELAPDRGHPRRGGAAAGVPGSLLSVLPRRPRTAWKTAAPSCCAKAPTQSW